MRSTNPHFTLFYQYCKINEWEALKTSSDVRKTPGNALEAGDAMPSSMLSLISCAPAMPVIVNLLTRRVGRCVCLIEYSCQIELFRRASTAQPLNVVRQRIETYQQ